MLHVNIGCISTCGHPSSREKEEVEDEEGKEEKWNVEKRRSKGKKNVNAYFLPPLEETSRKEERKPYPHCSPPSRWQRKQL